MRSRSLAVSSVKTVLWIGHSDAAKPSNTYPFLRPVHRQDRKARFRQLLRLDLFPILLNKRVSDAHKRLCSPPLPSRSRVAREARRSGHSRRAPGGATTSGTVATPSPRRVFRCTVGVVVSEHPLALAAPCGDSAR